MNTAMDISTLLINTLGSMALLVFLLRFLLQLVRADFYNPISQFIVKATNPLLIPLRRMIPGYGGLDLASLILVYAIQVIMLVLLVFAAGHSQIPWVAFLVLAPFKVLLLLLNIYFWGLIIVVVASWVAPNSYNPALILINQIIEPVMRPIRRFMPDLGGIDLSPIVLFLGIQVLEVLVSNIGNAVLQSL